ncbi:MAG: MFS transporter [Pseudomonadota bacterium]
MITDNRTTISNISNAPLYWLALGTFAVGAEGFMIAGILPSIAADLAVSVSVAGQLVAAFAFAYAISSPILTALSGSLNRRRLLIIAMGAFALANLLAWSASGYWSLMGARILLAFAAGVYVPSANALAGALVAPERRGSALAIVNGGLTVAIALGVPLGTFVANTLGWRMTFAGLALIAAGATAGLSFGLPENIGAGLPSANLRDRISVARQPAVLLALLGTTLWAMGGYTVYTYLALFVQEATTIQGAHVGLILFTWGASAAIGVAVGGMGNDKLGFRSVILPALASMIAAFLTLSASAHLISKTVAIAPVFLAVVVWGIAAWAFYPAQQARLIAIAGVKLAPIALSLNASFMYLGFSLGAGAGSLTLAYSHASNLGLVATGFVAASLLLTLRTTRPLVSAAGPTTHPAAISPALSAKKAAC